MAKIKNITITADNAKDAVNQLNEKFDEMRTEHQVKPVTITEAVIKEELCNYKYEINQGPGSGDKVTRKGSQLVHEDMDAAFEKLNKHLAHLDDAFVNMKKKPLTLSELESHEETISNFKVTGVKISGSDENEGFILLGDKYVSQGTIALETPKISASSGYTFFDDLKQEVESCQVEVEAYMNGKAAPKMEQGELEFNATGGDDVNHFENPQ